MQASSTYSSSEARRHPILVNLTLLVKRRLTPNPLLTRVRRESDKARRGVNPDTERKIVLSTWRKKVGGETRGWGYRTLVPGKGNANSHGARPVY